MKNIAYVSVLTIIALFILLVGGCGNSSEQTSSQLDETEMTSPAQLKIQAGDSLLFSSTAARNGALHLPADMSDSLVVAYSFVEPSESLGSIKSLAPGTMIHFSLDENLTITARINRNQVVGDTVQSLTGSIQEPYTGNITLSVNQGMLSGTIDVLSENRLFYIRYDQKNSRHYLAEIDRTKLDIQQGSQPLELN